jgi:hypothetical protein
MPVFPEPPGAPKSRWYYTVWAVLFSLFFVLGPLGLPLLWKSPHFSRTAKLLLTGLVLAVTWWAIVVAIHAVRAVVERTQELQLFF